MLPSLVAGLFQFPVSWPRVDSLEPRAPSRVAQAAPGNQLPGSLLLWALKIGRSQLGCY